MRHLLPDHQPRFAFFAFVLTAFAIQFLAGSLYASIQKVSTFENMESSSSYVTPGDDSNETPESPTFGKRSTGLGVAQMKSNGSSTSCIYSSFFELNLLCPVDQCLQTINVVRPDPPISVHLKVPICKIV